MITKQTFRVFALVAATCGLFLSRPQTVEAGSLRSDLAVYVSRIRAMYPEAEVISGFYDWRTVSMYRASAGLHLGYDIAMNRGRAVPAGWPGTVVAIVPWTDTQYGITVETAGGYRVTYGHLTPTVREGQSIQAGTFVGNTLIDHVDVKVKSASGGYLDFGSSYGVLDGTNPWMPGGSGLGLLPPPPDATHSTAGMSVEALVDNYRQCANYTATCKAERDALVELIDSLSRYIDRESDGLPQAEQQILAWYRAADQKQITEAQAEAQSLLVKARRARVNRLIYMMMGRQHELSEKEAAYQTARARSDAAREAAVKAGAPDDRLVSIDRAAKPSGHATSRSYPELEHKVAEARRQYEYIQERYSQGGAARTQLEDAERNYERLRLAFALWQHGNADDAQTLIW